VSECLIAQCNNNFNKVFKKYKNIFLNKKQFKKQQIIPTHAKEELR
jgi:hypothetical protein